jgi:glycosyltransferase involved in cell wall biosynthesis
MSDGLFSAQAAAGSSSSRPLAADGSAHVSVVLALHNGLRFLPQQIRSVLDQLRPGDEVIVIDDASSDGSSAWIEALADSRISLHRHAANAGVIRTFERGLSIARHEIVFLCDQDDVWLPGKRDAIVTAFEAHPSAQIVVSDAQVIDASGSLTLPSYMATRGGFRAGLCNTLWKNRYLGCAMAIRRQTLAAALPIPRRAPMHDMWLGIVGGLLGDVVYLPSALIQYRRHGGNASPSRHQGIVQMLRWRWSLIVSVANRWPTIARCRAALRRSRGSAPS